MSTAVSLRSITGRVNVRPLASASRSIARQRLAAFPDEALAPQIDGVTADARDTRDLPSGSTVGQEQDDPASQRDALWRRSRPKPPLEDEAIGVSHDNGGHPENPRTVRATTLRAPWR